MKYIGMKAASTAIGKVRIGIRAERAERAQSGVYNWLQAGVRRFIAGRTLARRYR
jgi:hypothetical protein